jgi:hypothetical protein
MIEKAIGTQMNADFQDYTKYLKQFLPLDLCAPGDLCG